ncbi:YncE family protein [Cytobacillus sp. Hm23]
MSVVYITNGGNSTVSVIDTKTHSVVTTIQVENSPFLVTFTPDGKLAYVTNSVDGTVSVIDVKAHSVISTVQVGQLPLLSDYNVELYLI